MSLETPLAPRSSSKDDDFIVAFEPGDPANPRNWPRWRKWLIVLTIIPVDLSVSWGASGFSPSSVLFSKDFHVSSEVAVLGLSLYVLGLALGPMPIAPLSEYYGRTLLYVVPYGVFLLLLLGTALVQNLAGFLALRLFSGFFSSVTIANFGGTIADLWPHHETGVAMSLFLWAATSGSSSGFFLLSFATLYETWRATFWILLIVCGCFWLVMIVVLVFLQNETRHSVLLARRAKKLRHQTGNQALEVADDMKQRGVAQLFKVTLSRPFRFLATESIIIFAALYNGYLYGLSFLFNDAFTLVFGKKGYDFSTVGVGLSFLGVFVGISLGPLINLWQERHYQRAIRKGSRVQNIPEARVQLAKIAAVVFPLSLFWFAWTCNNQAYHIHWIVPILATVFFGWSFYTLILMTYMYTEDSYGVYSASALAGIGLVRNLAGAGFPLFGSQMFENLGYQWAGTLLACLALLLIPIPFVLERYGRTLRGKSPWASQHMTEEGGDRPAETQIGEDGSR